MNQPNRKFLRSNLAGFCFALLSLGMPTLPSILAEHPQDAAADIVELFLGCTFKAVAPTRDGVVEDQKHIGDVSGNFSSFDPNGNVTYEEMFNRHLEHARFEFDAVVGLSASEFKSFEANLLREIEKSLPMTGSITVRYHEKSISVETLKEGTRSTSITREFKNLLGVTKLSLEDGELIHSTFTREKK